MHSRLNRRGTLELLWPRVVLRKLLNIPKNSDYGADSEIDDGKDSDDKDDDDQTIFETEEEDEEDEELCDQDSLPRRKRRNSETFRTQYIHTKDIRVCVGTWNVGGKRPPDDLDIEQWLNTGDPSDIYVIGLQEVVPLNAGNIFGAESHRPVLKWESMIRETLSRVQPTKKAYKSYSNPPSPSKFKPSDEILDFEDEILLETDSDEEELVHPVDEEPIGFYEVRDKLVDSTNVVNDGAILSSLSLDRLKCFESIVQNEYNSPTIAAKPVAPKLKKTLSASERIGLSWPEPPLNLVAQRVLERPHSFNSIRTIKSSKSFRAYSSLKVTSDRLSGSSLSSDTPGLVELDLELLRQWRKRKPEYVRIVSKQMIGVFLTVWVRKSLRKHIQNLKVSTVGVGVMGYIGNKGAVSVSMSIYQTLFCFICTHLTSGEKEMEQLKRTADVNEIHRRTLFRSDLGLGVPKRIYDHERIIWLGDLNYRISLPYDETRQLISRKAWTKLAEKDQLGKELRKGHVFEGWSEGVLSFPPTYKYETDSDNYIPGEPKSARRTPAWCDRILSFGKGIKLMEYKRSELKMSDHRPVTAVYDIEVEVFSYRKLQKALTYTDAEVENGDVLIDSGIDAALISLPVLTLKEMLASDRP